MTRGILDIFARSLQALWGPTVTGHLQNLLGGGGTRFVRELLGRSARHRIQVACPMELIGQGNDAWVVSPATLRESAVVYSLGVGNEVGFDLALVERYGVEVFAFDPSPTAIAFVASRRLPARFHFIERGIADFDGLASFYHRGGKQYGLHHLGVDGRCIELPVQRLASAMNALGHRAIDLLKINIEGGEYAVIRDLLVSNVPVRQIVVEFHHRFPGYSLAQTKEAVRGLIAGGYWIFYIAENGKEYSFMKLE